MRIAVTGSIATDHLMTFPGRFADALVEERLDRLSLSFLVDELQIRRGGVAANIAYGMALLGLRPVLVGAVGDDFNGDYRAWLDRHGVDTASVHVSDLHHTARFLCTTDADNNQLASFYAGAMSEARFIELAPVAARLGGLDLVVVSPNDPEAMVRHTEECRDLGVPFMADPSQQLARMAGPEVQGLVDGARYLVCNDYEAELVLARTGWTREQVLERVGCWIVTQGPKGATLMARGAPDLDVPAVPELVQRDPTGVGDAFRAGFLAGLAVGLPDERSAQVGSLLATHALETVGTQEYALHPGAFLDRFREAFGDPAAQQVSRCLPARRD